MPGMTLTRKQRRTLTPTERLERERHRRAQSRERTRARQAARRIPRTEELALALLDVFLTSTSSTATITELTRRFEQSLVADGVDMPAISQRLKALRRRLLLDKV